MFFRPRSVLLVGAATALGQVVAANLVGFGGTVRRVEAGEVTAEAAADLAVLACEPGEVAAVIRALAAAGTGAVVCLTPVPGLAEMANAVGMRAMGPASFGIVVPSIGLNASTSHLAVQEGRVALVSQSAALCRAVVDWAEPNGVGFSHIVGTGGNVQTGFAATLDWLSRDGGTGAILLDIRTIRDRRAFMAAARAAARLRPVVAIRAGGRLRDPSGQSDLVFQAAMRRAGVLLVSGLANLLGALEVLTRARPPRTETLAIVTNAVGPAQMAADEAVALGISLLELDAVATAVLGLRLPAGPTDPGIVWTGADGPMRLGEAAAMVAGMAGIGGVVVILAPTGTADGAAVAGLAAAQAGMRVPLLVCVLGETTGAGHRRALAAAGVPAFASPEAAVRAFGQLVQQRRARVVAAELPPRRVLLVAPDHGAVVRVLEVAREAGRVTLLQDEALGVLSAYGMAVVPGRAVVGAEEAADAAGMLGFPAVLKPRDGSGAAVLDLVDPEAVRRAASGMAGGAGVLVQRQAGRARALRIVVVDDPVFGPAIGFGLGGGAGALLNDLVFELPPLNLALARVQVGRARAAALLRGLADGETALEAAADALVRVSQLVVDHPEIAGLEVQPLLADGAGVSAAGATLALRGAGERGRLAITPYPGELAGTFDARGERLLVRPIRPEDAEAHGVLFRSLSPEDIRYRFFNMLRELPAEQVARMTQVDYDREMAFVAVREGVGREEAGETVGVARLVREPGTDGGEFAVVVGPGMKGRGVARHLMERLAEWGREQGMSVMTGQVLAENAPMLAFMRRIGAVIRRLPDEHDVVEAVISLGVKPEVG